MGYYYFVDKIEESIRPRYMEAVEESLNDTAHLLASLLEREFSQKNDSLEKISERILSPVMRTTTERDLNSKIFEITKKKVDLQLYVTDERGIVIYDSEKLKKGQDYSKKNDVYLTLQGKYGARSSLLFGSEKGLFVAAPIRKSGKIIGVLTVIKPKKSLIPFIESARKKFWNLSLYVALSIIILFISILYFLFSPIRKLSEYISALRFQKRVPFPKISVPEIRGLGEEMDRLFRELAGKEYVENYVQSMTHEIKSPLSSLLASSELIIENPDRLESLVSNIQLEGRRIQTILEKLLELSSLENQSQLEKKLNLNLQDVVQETVASSISEAVRKKIRFRELTETVYVEGNFFFLGMALRNLVQNALDFSNPGSEITVRCGKENGFPFLEVEDSGPGIPSYALERIFEKFYSLPRPDTGRKSSGLGLAFVREIAKLHDADLEVKNGTSTGVIARICFKTIF
ncbi:two-component system sensor histidine kinase CreC [Leptospira interrogans]|uniref:two-component system sensor histidine kinase CreC n=1 Tax=Leptospira interrogans TaxID=173 RepID=UPI0009E60FD6|nr:two-component system sensor histidine kinase CreC [Leptospira interrogans]MCW3823690.1 two-component system sensor histidine kinase CreC [Leptospira interrogans]MDC2813310.1 two-component system sensor histidine kinase CreC [Leptospira interrogans]QOI38467.1 two-component system sensor histidine kinase CreC [Leptospira interrogans serovar Bataviae]QYY62189.1 two-component system sensor histidine kinase CreC [Leptospira interrogans serovar Bataviae]ULG82145.1 two-component system sensor hist